MHCNNLWVTINSHVTDGEVMASTWGQWCAMKIGTLLLDLKIASVAKKNMAKDLNADDQLSFN